MNIAYACVAVAGLLPYLFVAYAKSTKAYLQGGNRAPREYGNELTGARQRAYWAHLNSFEVFPLFAAAVIIAGISGGADTTVDALACCFIASRLLYGVFYILDRDRLRSLCWGAGMLCIAAIFGATLVATLA